MTKSQKLQNAKSIDDIIEIINDFAEQKKEYRELIKKNEDEVARFVAEYVVDASIDNLCAEEIEAQLDILYERAVMFDFMTAHKNAIEMMNEILKTEKL